MDDRNPNLNGSESENDDDFSFSFAVDVRASTSDPADEIFSNCKILPLYPVFDRALLLSDPDPNPSCLRSESASSTSSAASVDTDAAQNYCEWTPNRAWKKSGSTGSEPSPSKGWRVRDLVGGKRSHSDGKEKLGYLNAGLGTGTDSGKSGSGDKREMDLVTAHKLFYGKEKGGGGGKKSFLPYKPELVGLFAKGSRARHHNPFNL